MEDILMALWFILIATLNMRDLDPGIFIASEVENGVVSPQHVT